MEKALLLVTIPVIITAAVALAKGVPALTAALQQEELANLPLAATGTVDLPEAGEIVLSLRGALGSRDFAQASFTLRDPNGQAVPSSMIVVRSSRTTLAGDTTLSVRRFSIPAAGRYQLDVSGLGAEPQSTQNRLILSKAGDANLTLRIVWVVGAAVTLLAAIVFSALVAFAQPSDTAVRTPAVGSPTRTALLNAVRATLQIPSNGDSRFNVFHLKTADAWAYFEGNEVVRVEGREWQETDRTVRALLQQRESEWIVRAWWSVPTNDQTSLQEFERQVAALRQQAKIPTEIFP